MASNLEVFFKLAGRLKLLKRTGWVKRKVVNVESVADHTFRVALMAMVLGHLKRQRGESLDLERALCLALLHDLPEAIMGDLDPETKRCIGEERTKEAERYAVAQISSLLPKELQALYEGFSKEYRAQSTPEALLVSQLDRAEMLLQAHEYATRREGSGLDEFWRDWRRYVTDIDVSRLLEGLSLR